MRVVLYALATCLSLTACGSVMEERARQQTSNKMTVDSMIRDSVVSCADGNQVRTLVYNFGGNATAFSTFTILDEDGKPKRCVRREKSTTPMFEEVPE